MISAGGVSRSSSHGVEAEVRERRPVGVDDPVLAIADRHRVAERTDDRLEAPLAAVQRPPQLLDQPLALALGRLRSEMSADERVEGPPVAVAHAPRSSSRPGTRCHRAQRRHLDPPIEQRPGAVARNRGARRCAARKRSGTISSATARPTASLARDAEHPLGARIPVGHRPRSSIETTAFGARSRICSVSSPASPRIIRIAAQSRQTPTTRPAPLTIPGATCGL